jgi:hypothetical protein
MNSLDKRLDRTQSTFQWRVEVRKDMIHRTRIDGLNVNIPIYCDVRILTYSKNTSEQIAFLKAKK